MTSASWFTIGAATAAQPIPFRQDPPGPGTSLTGALLIAVVMLSVVAVLAWHARRRGWLDRWVGPSPSPRAQAMRVDEVLRLSPQTTLFRVHHDGEVLLIVESKVSARLERSAASGPHPAATSARAEADDA